ncbi:MAG: class II aldolase/adducin family protein [Pseudomonadota bacterium]
MATEHDLRADLIAACRALGPSGLSQGTSGNVSVRCGNRMLISPSATPYDVLEPEMVASLDLSGAMPNSWDGPLKPSTEWRFHWLAMKERPDITAVVHAHPPYCTALAILRKPIPACHYMIAAFGGTDVRVADYQTFGSAELAAGVMEALQDRYACLMANHGMVAVGTGLTQAMWRAGELEEIARQYHLAMQIGEPPLLSQGEVESAFRMMSGYGVPGG